MLDKFTVDRIFTYVFDNRTDSTAATTTTAAANTTTTTAAASTATTTNNSNNNNNLCNGFKIASNKILFQEELSL
jgi:hypothetical protein